MFHTYTYEALKVITFSQEEAKQENFKFVATEHLLIGLIRLESGIASSALRGREVTVAAVQNNAKSYLKPRKKLNRDADVFLDFTPAVMRIFYNAYLQAMKMEGAVCSEHLLLALIEDVTCIATRILYVNLKIRISDLRTDIYRLITSGYGQEPKFLMEQITCEFDTDYVPPEIKFDDDEDYYNDDYPIQKPPPSLKEFSHDLTKAAENQYLDPVIGRDKEIEHVIQILTRRRKNNPILIGEPGVGKTAVVEGLAQQIIGKQVPDFLQDRKIISLDMSLLLSGTKYRGDFELRIKRIIELVNKSQRRLIVFIDEIHTIVGAGSSEGDSMDAANMLKPALARGELQCIGATTIDEYKRYIEEDPALARRFQRILVGEPSLPATTQILHRVKRKYENHHKVKYSDESIDAAIRMGIRYIPERFLPDKAIDLIDEAGAYLSVQTQKKLTEIQESMPEYLKELYEYSNDLNHILTKKTEAIYDEDFEEAGSLLLEERQIREIIDKLVKQERWTIEEVNQMIELSYPIVSEDEVAESASIWKDIPVTKLTDIDSKELLGLEKTLSKEIIGQETAISAIAKAIRRSRVGLRDPNKPIASFLFAGPTGVGKTELARAVARNFFGGVEELIRLDMSEYMEQQAISKLIGPPPGYIGYAEGGQLTEAVRRKPYAAVLFDEIEKAHPDIYNLMLQVFDDGRLTDSQGHTVNFKNTMLILTSNIGAEDILEKANDLEIMPEDYDFFKKRYKKRSNGLKSIVNKKLKGFFRPEFLNRLDEVIIFRPLTKDNLKEIADIMLSQLNSRTQKKGFQLDVSSEAKDLLIEEGYAPGYGARPLRRAIINSLEDRIAQEMLNEQILPGSVVLVGTKVIESSINNDQEQLELDIKIQKPKVNVNVSANHNKVVL